MRKGYVGIIYLLWVVVLAGLAGCVKPAPVAEQPQKGDNPPLSFSLPPQASMPGSILGKDGVIMVLIPGGEFLMGSPEGEGDSDEHPQHTGFLDAFYMDAYEVTNTRYQQFMDATGHSDPELWKDSLFNAPNQPVVGVTWHDAVAYCEWAGKRLPTEAEWEKAARGGLDGKKYPWGDSIDSSQARYGGSSGTVPVRQYAPNGYGLYDMAGNVWEWCADRYDGNYYANSPRENPTGPDSSSNRVLRGGSWFNYADDLRVAARDWYYPTDWFFSRGFRCAQDISF